MPDYLKAARNAKSPSTRRKFSRLHRAQRVRDRIVNCTLCPLHATCTAPVPWDGSWDARILLVGEAPGRNEDVEGVPFVGASGKLLDRLLAKASLSRSDTMILNSVCCRPPNNRTPQLSEVEACEVNLEAQLKLSAAYVGVLLGKSAFEAVVGRHVDLGEVFSVKPSKFGDLVGQVFWFRGRVWIASYHPAYLIRNRQMQFTLVQALGVAKKISEGIDGWPKRVDVKALKFADEPGSTLRNKLRNNGWVKMYSGKLEDVIVIVKDEESKYRIPQHVATQYPVYTIQELVKIGVAGEANNRMTREDLQAIHLVKTQLGGVVLA